MKNLTTALTQILTNLFDHFSEKDLPVNLTHNTVSIYEVEPSTDVCKSLFFYVRKNELDLITDIELIGSNAKLPGEVAVDLIYPYQFHTVEDLKTKVTELTSSICNLLKQQIEESKQMSLFPIADYSLN